MTKLSHTELEKSTLYLALSESLLSKLDSFLSDANFTTKQQKQLIKLLEDTYGEAYVNSLTD
jgi:hypothetical protein